MKPFASSARCWVAEFDSYSSAKLYLFGPISSSRILEEKKSREERAGNQVIKDQGLGVRDWKKNEWETSLGHLGMRIDVRNAWEIIRRSNKAEENV
jgi:hypothetical protein